MNTPLLTTLSPTLERLWRSQHALVALDAQDHIVDGNAAFCALLEHPHDTLINQPLAAFCTPETPLGVVAHAAEVVDITFDKRHYPQAFTLLKRNGHKRQLHVVETWLIKNSGTLMYVLVLATAENKQATLQALETYFDEIIVEATTTRYSQS